MAAITPSVKSQSLSDGRNLIQYYGTSATNQADTMTTPTVKKGKQRLISVSVSYDGSATFTGSTMTVGIDSGISPLYDWQTGIGTDNTQYTLYNPTNPITIIKDDAFIIAVPAGGSGREASIVVTVEAEG